MQIKSLRDKNSSGVGTIDKKKKSVVDEKESELTDEADSHSVVGDEK